MVNYITLRSAFEGRRILITGHTGFKGSWLALLLKNFDAKLYGYSVSKHEDNQIYSDEVSRLFEAEKISDILNLDDINDFIQFVQPEYIFHLAAQSLVSISYEEPLKTISTNVIGTANLLEASRGAESLKRILIVTTDKVYFNDESGRMYGEDERLGGRDVYSGSKAATEIISESYFHSFFKNCQIPVITVRSGNVIGGGDFSMNRIIPDIIKSVSQNEILQLRSPQSVRPWLHVLDTLFGYCFLATVNIDLHAMQSFNIAPLDANRSVLDVMNVAQSFFPSLSIKVDERKNFLESVSLNLDGKLMKQLGFIPKLTFDNSLQLTFDWYKKYLEGESAVDLCNADIRKYISELC